MSTLRGDVFVIEVQKPQACELCGKIEETRPYGPNGQEICFDCGQQDPDGTAQRFAAKIAAVKEVQIAISGILIVERDK